MKKECKYCKKTNEYDKIQQFAGHVSNCLDNPFRLNKTNKLKILFKGIVPSHIPKKCDYILNCKKCNNEYTVKITEYAFINKKYNKFCSRTCANSHIRTNESKNKSKISAKLSEKVRNVNTNPELIKIKSKSRINDTNRRLNLQGKIANISEVDGKVIRLYNNGICKYCNQEINTKTNTVKKYHSKCWLKCAGGYKVGSGRGKKGWYKGYWCDSSWELAFVIYNIDHNIKFERNKTGFVYRFKNKDLKYYPDFIIDGVYYEIKGYNTLQFIEKSKSIPNLKILFEQDLKYVFDYVINKYGKNFLSLYD